MYSPITSAKHRKLALTIAVRSDGISTRTSTVPQPAPRLRAASTSVAESIERMPASSARYANGIARMTYTSASSSGCPSSRMNRSSLKIAVWCVPGATPAGGAAQAYTSLIPTTKTIGGNTSGNSVSTSTMPRHRGSRRCSNNCVGSISPIVTRIVTTAISSE